VVNDSRRLEGDDSDFTQVQGGFGELGASCDVAETNGIKDLFEKDYIRLDDS